MNRQLTRLFSPPRAKNSLGKRLMKSNIMTAQSVRLFDIANDNHDNDIYTGNIVMIVLMVRNKSPARDPY